MRTPVPYTYVVATRRRRTSRRWALSILHPNGLTDTLTSYASRAKAIAAAKMLAGDAGSVQVRP